jgi:flagellar basal body-associated protein FliL
LQIEVFMVEDDEGVEVVEAPVKRKRRLPLLIGLAVVALLVAGGGAWMTLMSHDAAAIEVAKEADPVIRNALVLLLASQDSASISDTAGREKLQEQALAAVQKIIQARLGRPGLKAWYFTSFVMQ